MKKIFKKEVIIGATVILAMAVLFVGIDFLKGINVFKQANYYYVEFDNVAGLAQSAPVTVNGFKIGLVREINYQYDNPGHVLVEISLDKHFRVPRGTVAVLASDLLGTATIQLRTTPSKDYCAVGTRLEGETPSSLMDAVASDLMPSVSSIFPKIDTLLTNINTLVANPALTRSIGRLDEITANLEATTRSLNTLVASLPPIVADVKSITTNVDNLSADLTQVSSTLSALPIDSIASQLQTTIANLRELSRQLNDPQSSLGLLMNDPALYNNLNTTVNNLDSLFVDIKKNPKRYINIKLL